MTHVRSVNDAVVSANSLVRAKSLLEDYLRQHPLNPEYPNMTLPVERDFHWKLLEHRADREGVIYSSQDRR